MTLLIFDRMLSIIVQGRSIRSLLKFCLPLVIALVWSASHGYQGLNGQDAHDYLHLAEQWTAWSAGSSMPVMIEHPHGYPIAGALLRVVTLSELVALRVISLVAFLTILFLVRGVLIRSSDPGALGDVFVLLTLGLAPFLMRGALMVMSDVPAIALITAAYTYTLNWTRSGRVQWLIGAIIAVLFALSFRLAVAPMGLILGIALVHGPKGGRKARWIWVGVLLGSVIALMLYLIPVETLLGVALSKTIGDWSLMNLFRTTMYSDDGTLTYALPNLIYSLKIMVHPGFLVIGSLLLPFFRTIDLRSDHVRLAALLSGVYLIFIMIMPFQNDRILMMASPFIAISMYPSFQRALAWLVKKSIPIRGLVITLIVLQTGLFVRAMVPFIQQSQQERDLAKMVVSAGVSRVYTHGMGAAFQTYCPQVQVTELWYDDLPSFDHNALVVVRPSNLTEQWTGRTPARNWALVQKQGVEILGTQQDGWVIARVR